MYELTAAIAWGVLCMASVALYCVLRTMLHLLRHIRRRQEVMYVKLSELLQVLTDLQTQIDKAKAEILAKIALLELALSDVDLPADAQAKIDELKGVVQALDDIVPDQP